MNVYPFIEAEKADSRNVARACELLQVSRSAYYQQRDQSTTSMPARKVATGPRASTSARDASDTELTEQIHTRPCSAKASGWPGNGSPG